MANYEAIRNFAGNGCLCDTIQARGGPTPCPACVRIFALVTKGEEEERDAAAHIALALFHDSDSEVERMAGSEISGAIRTRAGSAGL